ncbi:hypothetical protein SFUMM280S_01597 [Streptomyces fumanus]
MAVEDALTKAGFDVVSKEVDAASFYEQVGKLDNPYDAVHHRLGPGLAVAGDGRHAGLRR